MVDAGPVQVTAEKEHFVYLPPVLGAVALIGGSTLTLESPPNTGLVDVAAAPNPSVPNLGRAAPGARTAIDLRTALYVCAAAPILSVALCALLPPSRERRALTPEVVIP